MRDNIEQVQVQAWLQLEYAHYDGTQPQKSGSKSTESTQHPGPIVLIQQVI